MSEVESLQKRLAGLTEEAAKEVEQANHARQEMREIKEQLERTVAEKLQLEEEVERLYRAKAEKVSASSVMLRGVHSVLFIITYCYNVQVCSGSIKYISYV